MKANYKAIRKMARKAIRRFNARLMDNPYSRLGFSALLIMSLTIIFTGIFVSGTAKASNSAEGVEVVELEVMSILQAVSTISDASANTLSVNSTPNNFVVATGKGSVYTDRRYLDVTLTAKVQEYVNKYIEKYGNRVDAELVYSLMYTESRFNPKAENETSHCSGIMQLNPEYLTDKIESFGYDDIFDLEGNIEVGIWYLSELVKDHGDLRYALTCYHRGSAGAYYYFLAHNDYDAYAYEVYGRYENMIGENTDK